MCHLSLHSGISLAGLTGALIISQDGPELVAEGLLTRHRVGLDFVVDVHGAVSTLEAEVERIRGLVVGKDPYDGVALGGST